MHNDSQEASQPATQVYIRMTVSVKMMCVCVLGWN